MRLKHIKGAEDAVADHRLIIRAKSSGRTDDELPEIKMDPSKKLYLEIGCGKGQFILTKALNDPSADYIGVEMYSSVLLRALQRCDALPEPISNLHFINDDALRLKELLGGNTVDGIYLNFSDPWPKERHSKRRLTSKRFLDSYKAYLKKGAFIEFKTDNVDLFDFSLEEIRDHPDYDLKTYTYDLYDCREMLEGNVATEYEEKFTGLGYKICKLTAIYKG